MMARLYERGQAAANEAKRRRLKQIAGRLREQGLVPEIGADAVAIRGKNLLTRWIADPLLRFAGSVR